jgi:transposase
LNEKKPIELFVAGAAARTAASLADVNKNTASDYFKHLRELIYDYGEHLELLNGEIEAGESYFCLM